MGTKTDERIDEMRDRIDRLEARAQAAGGGARESMRGRADALRRQEASARAAVREHSHAAESKLRQLESNLKAVDHALDAELAENKKDFADSMEAYLDDFKELSHDLRGKATTMSGTAREQAEAAISDLQRSRDTVGERLAETRQASGERWRERKKAVAAARAELERKADEAMKKFG